ncbi:hypothetical protein ACFRH4_12550 [Streptomyces mirabilis]|uniref:hypothetical protein n=1 Tax=Streptomyces mirabilis TaxID=68239 RepID=UPI00368F3338
MTLSGIACVEVFVEGAGDGSFEGKWEVKQRTAGEAKDVWVSMEFPAGVCGNSGRSESGFYPYEDSGQLVLHLGDPGMTDRKLDFFKT